ncbi:MAG: hypothetical protein KA473_16410 [Anaerolineales bacterium]|nr:hypothetical protein [Anaerolineales bacterium]MBP6211016.1 hypothetical protein [Anaerolineales bacterium]
MYNKRLGCLTGTGIVATLITLVSIIGFALFSGNQMFSAGALNAQEGDTYGGFTSHAQIKDCSACHAPLLGAETMADRCASCHTDIASQMKDVAKLHGMITKNNPELSCRECHPEHRGSTASLTDMRNHTFPHEALGYSLKGHQVTVKNEPFTCSDCHPNEVSSFSRDTCDACHRDMDVAFTQEHVLSFGEDCMGCHDGVDTYGSDFAHTSYKLIGKHADAACTKCHLDAHTVAALKSAPQDCFSCHEPDDEHDGKFGNDCSSCHSPEGWTPADFNHDLADFKLEGEHREASCEDCHKNDVYAGTPKDCYSCHGEDDDHNGKFGTDCSVCHTPNDWEDATFEHERTRFPLTGKHTDVSCEDCHKNGEFKGLDIACISCHVEPEKHFGQFGTDCAACHSTDAWTPAKFNGEHTFPLDHGEEGLVSCATCHPVTYTAYTCYGCHEHNESNVRSEHLEEGISDFQNCMECHADGREHDD